MSLCIFVFLLSGVVSHLGTARSTILTMLFIGEIAEFDNSKISLVTVKDCNTILGLIVWQMIKKALVFLSFGWSCYIRSIEKLVNSTQFYTHLQREVETIIAYSAELQELATYCEFRNFLPQALRDCLAFGFNMPSFKKKLTMVDLTFKTAIEIVVSMEQAEVHTKEFKCPVGVHKVTYKSVRGTSRSEFRCGHQSGASSHGFGHGGNSTRGHPRFGRQQLQSSSQTFCDCFMCGGSYDPETCCNHCHKMGHIKSVCFQMNKRPNIQQNTLMLTKLSQIR